MVKKYDRKKNFEVDDKDRKQIHNLFEMFKTRTGGSKNLIGNSLQAYTKEYKDDDEVLDIAIPGAFNLDKFDKKEKKERGTAKDMVSFAAHALINVKNNEFDEKYVEESINKMLFKARLRKFQGKTSNFDKKAKHVIKELKCIGAAVNHGKINEEEKSLMDELWRQINRKNMGKGKKILGLENMSKKKYLKHSKLNENKDEDPPLEEDDKMKKQAVKLTCITYHYWQEMNYLILGFLSREIWIYELEYDYKVKYKFLDELRLKGYPSNFFITKSVFHECYFVIIV